MLLSKKLLLSINPVFAKFTNDEYINAFNMIGIEVEQIIRPKAVEGLVIGKIIEVNKLEDSEHLHVCKVELKKSEVQIVCGAENVANAKWVVVAPVGTKMADGSVIEERRVRGELSQGMICAYSEILPDIRHLLSEEENQSIICIKDPSFGFDSDLYDCLNLNDEIFDLAIPSNRNDLNGALSIVNELNYALDINFNFVPKEVKQVISPNLSVKISPDASKLIKSCLFGEFTLTKRWVKTPWEVKTILINHGIAVTDTVADLGNYATLMTAQPVQFYDADKVKGAISLELSKTEQVFESVNGTSTTIKPNTLISKANGEVAAAIGMIGSYEYRVTNKTNRVLFEVLTLDCDYMNEQSKVNNISNMSTTLFSKPLSSFFISKVYYWLEKYFKETIEVLYSNIDRTRIKFPFEYWIVRNLLGVDIPRNEVNRILAKTDISTVFNVASIPRNRLDLLSNQDLAEEVLKSLDINTFEAKPVVAKYSITKTNRYTLANKLSDYLLANGFYEVKTMNLTSEQNVKEFNPFDLTPYQIQNPMSSARAFFRVSTQHELLQVLQNNINKKNELFNLFEIQKVYGLERRFDLLTCLITKPIINDVSLKAEFGYQEAKYILECLFDAMNTEYSLRDTEEDNKKGIYVKGVFVGYVSKIKSNLAREYGLTSVYCIELIIDDLIDESNKSRYVKSAQLNPIFRELTITNKEDVNLNEYFDAVRKLDQVIDVSLVTIFKKNNKKTYTISIKIENKENLVTEEINAILSNIIDLARQYKLDIN